MMDDTKRKQHNLKMVDTLAPVMKPKALAVLADLQEHGYQPYIVSARRTIAQQREKVRLGYSKTMKSKHVDGMAIDTVDARWMYDSPRKFWLMLASSGTAHGLSWGGYFGLNISFHAALEYDINKKKWDTEAKIGWDASHLQMG